MDQKDQDAATIEMLMKRFNESRLPRAKRLLESVSSGEKLSNYDLFWLKKVYEDGKNARGLLKRNPEYLGVVIKFIDLYNEIIAKATENEGA